MWAVMGWGTVMMPAGVPTGAAPWRPNRAVLATVDRSYRLELMTFDRASGELIG